MIVEIIGKREAKLRLSWWWQVARHPKSTFNDLLCKLFPHFITRQSINKLIRLNKISAKKLVNNLWIMNIRLNRDVNKCQMRAKPIFGACPRWNYYRTLTPLSNLAARSCQWSIDRTKKSTLIYFTEERNRLIVGQLKWIAKYESRCFLLVNKTNSTKYTFR